MGNENIDPLMLAIFLGGMSLIPLLVMTTTSFLKIAIVLIITRNAIGVQQVPPNMTLYGIALAATFFIMAPVINEIGYKLENNEVDFTSVATTKEGVLNIASPLTQFMSNFTHPDIATHFVGTAKHLWPKDMQSQANASNPLIALPAFVISELQTGFEIGFLIFIPFIVIDLIVSNILLALGMQMVAPMTVSLPIKIFLFVMIDGWSRLLDSLIYSYV